MNVLALWIGYAVLTAGGVAFAGLMLGCALDYTWRKAQSAFGLSTLLTDARLGRDLREEVSP